MGTSKQRLPLYLTASRGALVVVLAVAFSTNSSVGYYVSLSAFLAAILTDILDGYLARRWCVASDFGLFLDAVADKLLVIVSIASLLMVGVVAYYCAIAFLMREVLADAIRNYAAGRGRTVPHDSYGRLQMLFTVLAVSYSLLALAQAGIPSEKPVTEANVLLGVGIGFGLLSVRAAWPSFVGSVADAAKRSQ